MCESRPNLGECPHNISLDPDACWPVFFPIIANCENFVQDHDNFFFVIFRDYLCLCTFNLRSPLLLTRNFVEGEAIGKEGNNLICFNMEQNYRCEKRLLTLNFLFQHFK